MDPFLPVVPAGQQRLIASLYVLETHLDMIDWLVRQSPSDNSSGNCEVIAIELIQRRTVSWHCTNKNPAADRVTYRRSAETIAPLFRLPR
ncbi:hypothetical protein ASG57_35350 [Bradyrhizobium sp. Leaf396]|nr:hypothetical protein ASG57_35350 [Bradyrhizobium sp. Leaf396]